MIGRAPSNRGVVVGILVLLLGIGFSGIPQRLMEPSLSASEKSWHTYPEPQYFCNGELTLIKDGWRRESSQLKGLDWQVRWNWKLMLKNTSNSRDLKIDFVYHLKDKAGKTVSSRVEHSLSINRLQTKTFSGTGDGSLSSVRLATDRTIDFSCQEQSKEYTARTLVFPFHTSPSFENSFVVDSACSAAFASLRAVYWFSGRIRWRGCSNIVIALLFNISGNLKGDDYRGTASFYPSAHREIIL